MPLQLYACAEFGMNAALSKVDGAWFLDARTASQFQQVLALHDQQFRSIKLKDLTAATERLERFVRSKKASPLPDQLRALARELAATDEPLVQSERSTRDQKST